MSGSSIGDQPVYIDSSGTELFGFFTRAEAPGRTTVLALTGGGWVPSTHRNRMWVRLSRSIRSGGLNTMRFDYRGVGESGGELRSFELESPDAGDVFDACSWLSNRGFHDVILFGSCFGGRSALGAAHAIPHLKALILSATPLEDYSSGARPMSFYVRKALTLTTLRRILSRFPRYVRIARAKLGSSLTRAVRRSARERPENTVSSYYMRAFTEILVRGIPILLIFGEEDDQYAEYLTGLNGPFGEMIAAAGEQVTLRLAKGRLHGETSTNAQDSILSEATTWLREMGFLSG